VAKVPDEGADVPAGQDNATGPQDGGRPIVDGMTETLQNEIPPDVAGKLTRLVVSAVAGAVPGIRQNLFDRNTDVLGEQSRDTASVERFFHAVLDVLAPKVIEAVPALVEEFRTVRKLPADDHELRSRWLIPLLLNTLPAVVHAVPDLVDQLVPEPELTDPNTASRWFGPVLSGVLPELVSRVSQVVSIFHPEGV
jgi:hypothetical protein